MSVAIPSKNAQIRNKNEPTTANPAPGPTYASASVGRKRLAAESAGVQNRGFKATGALVAGIARKRHGTPPCALAAAWTPR